MTHKVLIADDEPNIVVSLEFLMKREGYAVQVARDGARRWTRSPRAPDLVLLDVMMPRKSGLRGLPGGACRRAWPASRS
jgi:DNA-binding response OmpR family regulator